MRAQANGYGRRKLRACSAFDFCDKSASSSSLRSSKFCGVSSNTSGVAGPWVLLANEANLGLHVSRRKQSFA